MSLLPNQPQEIPELVQISERIKQQNLQLVQYISNQVTENINACWHGATYNPQDFLDTLGPYAASSMKMNRDLIILIKTYEHFTGLTIFNDATMALVGEFTTNSDGTVTVH